MPILRTDPEGKWRYIRVALVLFLLFGGTIVVISEFYEKPVVLWLAVTVGVCSLVTV